MSVGVPFEAQWLISPTRILEDVALIPGLTQWVKAMNCGVGHRGGLDPELLWLWRRPAAVGPIQPLAWWELRMLPIWP